MTNQKAPEAPNYEHQRAIMEGERNASLDAYSRVVYLTQTESRIYEAGFTNGWNRLAALVEAQQPAPSAAAETAQQDAACVGPCDRAPSGWLCTRQHGHDGPCAAEPTLSARSDEWVEGYAAGVRDGRKDALRTHQPSPTPQADESPIPADYGGEPRIGCGLEGAHPKIVWIANTAYAMRNMHALDSTWRGQLITMAAAANFVAKQIAALEPAPQADSQPAPDVDLIARGMRWEECEALMKEACAQAGVQWDEEKEPQSIAINVMQRLANAAHKVGFKLGLERMAAARAPADSVTAPAGGSVAWPVSTVPLRELGVELRKVLYCLGRRPHPTSPGGRQRSADDSG